MHYLLQLILIEALVASGVKYSSQPGFALHPLKMGFVKLLGGRAALADDKEDISFGCPLARLVFTPIVGCITCMASVWSLIVYSLFWRYSWQSLVDLPAMILAASAANTIVYKRFLRGAD